jgi:hypothetical protein
VRLLLAMPLLPAALLPLAPAQQADLLPQPARLEELPSEQLGTRFRTRRFEIVSDAPLKRDQAARFSQVMDTVPLAISRLPLPLLAPPEGEPPRIQIITRESDYEKAGGAPGSAGCYDSRGPRLLVHRRFLLNSPARANSRLGPAPDQDLLVHELGHLCMHRYLGRTPQWFAEGACEYLASLHHADGRFSFRGVDGRIRDHIRRHANRNDPTTPVTAVKHLVGLSGPEWSRFSNKLAAEHAYRHYATALLLFHYHLNGGADRRDDTRKRLEISLIQRRPATRWIDPMEIPGIEKSMARYWKPRGLQLRFVDP